MLTSSCVEDQLVALLRNVPLFAGLDDGQLAKLLPFVAFQGFEAGRVVVEEGEAGDSFYVIYSGQVEVDKRKGLWGQKLAAVLGPGDFFGELALMLGQPRSATVVCREPTNLLVFKRLEFEMMLDRHPDIAACVKDAARQRFTDR